MEDANLYRWDGDIPPVPDWDDACMEPSSSSFLAPSISLDSGYHSVSSPQAPRHDGLGLDVDESEYFGPCITEFEPSRYMIEADQWTPFECQVAGCDRTGDKGYFRSSDLLMHKMSKHPELEEHAKTPSDSGVVIDDIPTTQSTAKESAALSQRVSTSVTPYTSEFDCIAQGAEILLCLSNTNAEQSSNALPKPLGSIPDLQAGAQKYLDIGINSSNCQNFDMHQDPSPSSDTASGSTSTTEPSDKDIDVEKGQEQSRATTIDPSSAQSSRVPSPWQHATNILPSEERRINDHLSRSLAWLLDSMRGKDEDSEVSTQNDVATSERTTRSVDFGVSLTSITSNLSDDSGDRCSNSGSTNQASTQSQNSSVQGATSSSTRCASKKRPRSFEEDGDGDDSAWPPPKQLKISDYDAFEPSKRFRYACPYNKWDPSGCPLCCMPSSKNREGGAETFSRVKSHIFRNHDLSTRCQKCWSSFPNKTTTLDEHTRANDCMAKASPTKYWMTEEQRLQVRGQRFLGSGDENWYHLFRLVLPHVSLDDEQGNYIVSPFYVRHAECLPALNSSGSVLHGTGNRIQAALPLTPTPAQQVLANPLLMRDNNSFSNTQPSAASMTLEDPWTQVPPFMFDASFDAHEPLGGSPSGAAVPLSTVPYPSCPTGRPLGETAPEAGASDEATPDQSSSILGPSVSQSPPNAFVTSDNERLRQNNNQLREEGRDMRRRIDAARTRVDHFDELLEAVLYHEGLPTEVSAKLFQFGTELMNLRKDLG